MPSSLNKWLTNEQYHQLKTLLGGDDIQIVTEAKGGNSKVFCVIAHGKKWAVKSYPPYAPNQRDRLAAEAMAYGFLNQSAIQSVPLFKTVCHTHRWLIMEWIEGNQPEHYLPTDLSQAIAFLQDIAHLNQSQGAQTLSLAAEACLSLHILLEQIARRYQRLRTIADMSLTEFLDNSFTPIFKKYEAIATTGYLQSQLNPHAELEVGLRSLIPADFGFHNSLRDSADKLYFFDFDYFGWDDPVKLLADLLWHPKMHLSTTQEQYLIKEISAIYYQDPSFFTRFRYTFPLFGLRWVLILLNEFIPAFWQNRQHAEAHQNEVEAKNKQLACAKELLKKVQQGYNYESIDTAII